MTNAKIMGTLFGVKISYPFNRKEIRELVNARQQIIIDRAVNGLTVYQTSLDANDEVDAFIADWSEADQVDILNLLTEETIALTNSMNDKINAINTQTEKVVMEQAQQGLAIEWIICLITLIAIIAIFAAR